MISMHLGIDFAQQERLKLSAVECGKLQYNIQLEMTEFCPIPKSLYFKFI